MLDWFSVKGVVKEVKGRIRWPKMKELVSDTKIVLVFILLFAAFFTVTDVVFATILRLLGIGA